MTQLVTEFAANDFVPGYAAKAEVAVQSRPSENTPIRLLITGFKTSAGSMTADTITGPVLSASEAATLAGPRSELARAYRAGARRSTDVEVWFGCVEEPSGGAAASARATIGGTWSEPGTIRLYVDGDVLTVEVGASDSTSDVADAIDAKVDAVTTFPCTATVSTATVAFVKAQKGTRGNSSILYVDLTDAPSGLTVTLEPPEADLVSLTAELRSDFIAHIALTTGGVHGGADSGPYTIASAPTTQAECITVLGQLLTAAKAHVQKTSGSVHGASDSTALSALNALTAPTTGAEAVAFANTFKTTFFGASGHSTRTTSSIHGAADSTNTISTANAPTGVVTGDDVTGDGLRFYGGSGQEDVAPLIAAIKAHSKWFKRIAVSSLDTTNLGLWETFEDEQAGPMVKRPSALILSHLGTQSAAQAITRTQLNHEAFGAPWGYDAETPALDIAVVHAVERVLAERNSPGGWNTSYSGTVLPGVKLARDEAKIPSDHATQKTALQNGLSPLVRSESGETVLIRAISTKCQNTDGSDNYGALDVAEFVCVHEVREMLENIWKFYRSLNKHVRDDFVSGEKVVPLVATPLGFARFAAQQLAPLVDERVFEAPASLRATFNRTTKRTQTVVEFTRLALHEQGEGLVRSLV